MAFARLLAKSTNDDARPRSEETLQGHTAQVLAAATALLDARGEPSLLAVGLPDALTRRLRRIVLLGAFVHDLGKCSGHFQAMVRGQRKEPQLLRHEAASLWLCWPGQPLAAWTRAGVDDDRDHLLALLAAAGHHRKFAGRALADDEGAGTSLLLLAGHPDFRHVLQLGTTRLGLPPPPALDDFEIRATRRGGPRDFLARWEADFDEQPIAAEDQKLLAVAKALVLAADVAGSALPRESEIARTWIPEQLARRPTTATLEGLVARRLSGTPLRPFQERVALSSGAVTLVTAGCGSGKTIAAWAWAARQHPGHQLWITYPTTGTATEGFRDYVYGADIHGRLEHSRALVDVEIFGLTDGDETRDRDRLDALRAWGAEAITCTVDTVLGLLQNQRKGLYAWPGLAGAAIVFDEVHAYDDRLFATLLRFLAEAPGIPVLLMTASLPAARLEGLREVVVRRHGQALCEIPGPPELEALPRYRFVELAGDPHDLIRAALARGEKVLRVSNTVARCMAAADGLPALVYHSRFRYVDRVARHGNVIDAFRRQGPALATTTQVAEMSLDLSADLLVTDLAPVPALIQRLGRLNRRSTPDRPAPVRPFVVLPFSGEPYERTDLDRARRWLERLRGRDISQRDLVRAWEQQGTAVPPPGPSAWLDGGFNTEPVEVRQASPGITVLLEDDARHVHEGGLRAEEAALPMAPPPRGVDPRAWRRVAYLPVVPAGQITYDPLRGAEWQRV